MPFGATQIPIALHTTLSKVRAAKHDMHY